MSAGKLHTSSMYTDRVYKKILAESKKQWSNWRHKPLPPIKQSNGVTEDTFFQLGGAVSCNPSE